MMESFILGSRSLERLKGVHPQLTRVVHVAIQMTNIDFTVLEGVRTEVRQRELYHKGNTTTLNSRHLTGHAVDIAPWVNKDVPWHDLMAFDYLGKIMFRAAHVTGEVIEWGGYFGRFENGSFDSFYDGPHFQLPWQMFPTSEKDLVA